MPDEMLDPADRLDDRAVAVESQTTVRSISTLNLISLVLAVSFVFGYHLLFGGAELVIAAGDLWKSLLLSCLILFLPQALSVVMGDGDEPVLREAGVTVVAVAVLCLLGWLGRYGLAPGLLTLLVLAGGVVAAVLGLFRALRCVNKWLLPLILGLAATFGAWLVAMAWGHGYQSPDFYERIPAGSAHIDTLFHSAIANSIAVLGYASTAVDGAPLLTYHWASHWIFARFSQLLDVPVLTFYNVSYQIVMLPLFFKAMGLMTLALRRARGWDPSLGVGFLAVLMVATITFWTELTSRLSAVWTTHMVLSESYSSALTFALLFSVIVVLVLRNASAATVPRMLLLMAIPLMVAVLGMLKVSLMILAAGAYWYWLLRARRLPIGIVLLSMLLTGMVVLGIITLNWGGAGRQVASAVTGAASNHWFYFLREMVADGTRNKVYFFILNYFWMWAYFGLILVAWRIGGFGRLFTLVKDRSLIEAEILLAVAVAGFIPGEVLVHRGGSYFYFSDVQRWLSITMVLALLPLLGASLRGLIAIPVAIPATTPVTKLASWPKTRASVLVLAILVGLGVLVEIIHRTAFNIEYRVGVLAEKYEDFANPTRESAGRDGTDSRRRAMVDALITLGNLRAEVKATACVYIPKVNKDFWGMIERPGAVSFVPPAVSGIRAILGIPVDVATGRGYGKYAFPDDPVMDLSTAQLRSVGRQYGCERIFVLRDDTDPMLSAVEVFTGDQAAASTAKP